MRSTKDYKIEVYWTRADKRVGIRGPGGGVEFYVQLASFEASIRLCSQVAATLKLVALAIEAVFTFLASL